MNFWQKITGNDMTKQMKLFDARIQKLPADYHVVWQQITAHLWQHTDFTGRNLMPIFDSTLSFFEETAAEGQTAKQIIGDDIEGFCTALIGKEAANTYRDKWRRQLNKSVTKKLKK